ncbi:hypothetical protein BgiMline_021413, partial [Biomphalaria glabrata]
EILEEDRRKRLLISVWHKDPSNGLACKMCVMFKVSVIRPLWLSITLSHTHMPTHTHIYNRMIVNNITVMTCNSVVSHPADMSRQRFTLAHANRTDGDHPYKCQ